MIFIAIFSCSSPSNLPYQTNHVAYDDLPGIFPNETVELYPTYAYYLDKEDKWTVHLGGRLFKTLKPSLEKTARINNFKAIFNLPDSISQNPIFLERVEPFTVNTYQFRRVPVHFLGRNYALGLSSNSGYFYNKYPLSQDLNNYLNPNHTLLPWINYQIIISPFNNRSLTGSVIFIPRTGISIISDIDNTIKDCRSSNKQELILDTFSKPFKAIPNMAVLYQIWQQQNIAFHYMSSFPWQLYQSLSSFLYRNGFPKGTFHLRKFKLNAHSPKNIFRFPRRAKTLAIKRIIKDFPYRQFILVGDSQNQDPEIYADIAKMYPLNIKMIYIRDLKCNKVRTSKRHSQIFKGVPPKKWLIFEDPEEIDTSINFINSPLN